MKEKPWLMMVLIAVAMSLTMRFVLPEKSQITGTAKKKSVFDRVMRTKTIRCGYGVLPPFLMKNPKTGEITGIYKDYMDAVGAALSMKVEWVLETGWGNMPTDLAMGHFDVYCSRVWENSKRAPFIYHSARSLIPTLQLYSRTDDKRFDGHMDAINHPKITITTLDGSVQNKLAEVRFPLAKKLEIPQDQTPAFSI